MKLLVFFLIYFAVAWKLFEFLPFTISPYLLFLGHSPHFFWSPLPQLSKKYANGLYQQRRLRNNGVKLGPNKSNFTFNSHLISTLFSEDIHLTSRFLSHNVFLKPKKHNRFSLIQSTSTFQWPSCCLKKAWCLHQDYFSHF